MPTVISNPASFTSVRNAFQTRGYGAVNNSLLAYRQGGGIVPSSSAFDGIGAGTSGDPLRLSQFSGFSVPDLLRFTTPFTGVNAGKFNASSRSSSGNNETVGGAIIFRTNKTCEASAGAEWNSLPGTADDGDVPNWPSFFGKSWGPKSWGSEDVVSSGYEARLNVTTFSQGNLGDGSYLRWGYSGSYHTITGTGFTPYYTLSSDVLINFETPYELYAIGQVFIRSIAFPSVEISTDWFIEGNNNA